MHRAFAFLAASLLLFVGPDIRFRVAAAEPVSAFLRDGRKIVGEIDARTDGTTLWLSATAPDISISRALAWRDVDHVQYAARDLNPEDFRTIALDLRPEVSHSILFEIPFAKTANDAAIFTPTARDPRAPLAPFGAAVAPRVVSLEIDARLSNWDQDAAADGFEVWVYPLDAARKIVPVEGSLSMRLVGRRRNRRGTISFPDVQRWSTAVRVDDFMSGHHVYRLPFNTVWPDDEFDLSSDAQLIVRLGAQGHGNFEASLPVQLRRLDRMRDDLQLQQGTRFFPNELAPRRPSMHRAW
jgi:hypothetical protein